MNTIKLSSRLQAVAELVKPEARVVDVGTDHGHIPVWLIQNEVSPYVYASDIAQGPLSRSRASAEKYGVDGKISFYLCDGLDLCRAEDVDTVIIAGMGGETAVNILKRAPWTREKEVILQPMSKLEVLRMWLYENGYAITREQLVRDSGVIYTIIKTSAGRPSDFPTGAELLVGREAVPRELHLELIKEQVKKISRAIDGMKSADNACTEMAGRLGEMQSVLRGLNLMLEGEGNGKNL
jgi:Predicted SAM-dependent methyltransferase